MTNSCTSISTVFVNSFVTLSAKLFSKHDSPLCHIGFYECKSANMDNALFV